MYAKKRRVELNNFFSLIFLPKKKPNEIHMNER